MHDQRTPASSAGALAPGQPPATLQRRALPELVTDAPPEGDSVRAAPAAPRLDEPWPSR